MENKGEEIKELLSHILNKLDRLEQKIERQEGGYKNLSY
jgi:archaellum component FlaC